MFIRKSKYLRGQVEKASNLIKHLIKSPEVRKREKEKMTAIIV
jgi:hypothetical protein